MKLNMNREKYIEFLQKKFGDEVLNAILDTNENKLSLKKGDSTQIYSQDLKDTIIEKIKSYSPEEYTKDIEAEMWAFDFPSWIGNLDFTNLNVKEIMVIGMEPHIRSRYYQATYGLRETHPNFYGELDEGGNEMLWKNLNDLFGNNEEYKNIDFLSRFYVTDLSHFAVKGKAKEIHRIKGWHKIRNNIAQKFLSEEIMLIKPKYIVSQGNVVADFIDKNIFKNHWELIAYKKTSEFKTKLPDKCKTSPSFKKYIQNGSTVIHLRLPHIASGNSNYFWTPAQAEPRKIRISGIKKELNEFSK